MNHAIYWSLKRVHKWAAVQSHKSGLNPDYKAALKALALACGKVARFH